MNELERIAHEAEGDYLLATVVRVAGSSYRRPGARMLVHGERWLAGCVSGGCLEGDVLLRGLHRCRDGPVVVTYDSASDDGDAFRAGLGCDGVVDVLLEQGPSDAIAVARACFATETTGVLATVIASARPDVRVGDRLSTILSAPHLGATRASGSAGELVHEIAPADARAAIRDAMRGASGVVEACGATVLVERIAPSSQLFVLGSGHDAAPLAQLARSIGFRVTVADRAIREPSRFGCPTLATHGDLAELARRIDAAREAYVVIMHHQRDADRDGLAMALASRAIYIGVLGPARRTRELLGDRHDPRVRAPVGIDLGAETPEQIALAIAAELQAVATAASAQPLYVRARPLHAEVALIVLAAGGSTRLGQPKQLLLAPHVARACVAARLGPVAVVTGMQDLEAALGDLPVARVPNPAWADGLASSIRAGVAWAETTGATGLVIALGDQPLLAPAHLAALRDAWLAGASAVGSRYAGVTGAPALFERARWPELAALTGDRGAGALLRDAPAIDWPDGAHDVDTPADLAALEVRGFPALTKA